MCTSIITTSPTALATATATLHCSTISVAVNTSISVTAVIPTPGIKPARKTRQTHDSAGYHEQYILVVDTLVVVVTVVVVIVGPGVTTIPVVVKLAIGVVVKIG